MKVRQSPMKPRLRASTLANTRKSLDNAKMTGMLPRVSASTRVSSAKAAVPPTFRVLRRSTIEKTRKSIENAFKKEELRQEKKIIRERTRTQMKSAVEAKKKPGKLSQTKSIPRSRITIIKKTRTRKIVPRSQEKEAIIGSENGNIQETLPSLPPKAKKALRSRTSAILSAINSISAEKPIQPKKVPRSRTTAPRSRTVAARVQRQEEKAASRFADMIVDGGLDFIFQPETYQHDAEFLQTQRSHDLYYSQFGYGRIEQARNEPVERSEGSFFGNALEVEQLMEHGLVEDDINGVYFDF